MMLSRGKQPRLIDCLMIEKAPEIMACRMHTRQYQSIGSHSTWLPAQGDDSNKAAAFIQNVTNVLALCCARVCPCNVCCNSLKLLAPNVTIGKKFQFLR